MKLTTRNSWHPVSSWQTTLRGRVLLVEADPAVMQISTRLLMAMGLQLTTASSGQQAIDIALLAQQMNYAFDLILINPILPIVNAEHVTKALRNHRLRTPIIALTAQPIKGDRDRCIAAGMDGYISTPFNSEVLFDEISRLSPAC